LAISHDMIHTYCHNMDKIATGMKVPGKTAPHLVYFFWELSIEFFGLFLLWHVVPNGQKYMSGPSETWTAIHGKWMACKPSGIPL